MRALSALKTADTGSSGAGSRCGFAVPKSINSTGSNPLALESAFQRAKELGANTVLSPVTWEMLEPEEDIWDFSQMKWALASAEATGLAWIPLWFGTLKNGQSTYVPPWVKKDPDRFPWAQDRSGRILRTLSLFSEETLQADCRAFGKFLEALSDVGAEHHVPLIQVQNEPGLLGSARDFSALAEPFYGQPTPLELGGKLWQETFGEGSEGAFSAWANARFVGRVASVGMAEFPVPRLRTSGLMKRARNLASTPAAVALHATTTSGRFTPPIFPFWRRIFTVPNSSDEQASMQHQGSRFLSQKPAFSIQWGTSSFLIKHSLREPSGCLEKLTPWAFPHLDLIAGSAFQFLRKPINFWERIWTGDLVPKRENPCEPVSSRQNVHATSCLATL